MKFEVIKYEVHEKVWDAHHIVKDENGNLRKVDPMVSGCLPSDVEPESLIGKTVEVEWVHPYIELAEGVKVL